MIDIFLYNIAWLRKHHGLSKKEMAKRLDIGLWSLNKIEKGELPPRLRCDIIFAVHQNFGIPCVILLDKRLGHEETDCHTSVSTGSQ
jgi:DNA-binding XRE family transcriptional regulator